MSRARPEPHRTAILATTVTAFFAICGIAVVDPILPIIGVEFGASTWQIELLFTAYVAVMAVGMIPAVLATGRFGYRAVLACGVGVVALAATGAAVSGSIATLAALRGLWGLGNAMFFATAMALLVALASDEEWAVELFETCVGLGFAFGPLIGGLLGRISWRAPFLLCGGFMVVALGLALGKLRDPAGRPGPLRLGQVFGTYRRPAFVVVCVVTAGYNFVFFTVLGFTPVYLGLDVVPLGFVFTAWGLGLAVGILGIGHRLAHRIGAVRTVGAALVVLLAGLIGLATSRATIESVLLLVVAGVSMGVCNAVLTDLALATGSPDRRVTTGAFNLVRWGFAAPAPVVAGLLADGGNLRAPYWVAIAVLAVALATLAVFGRAVARAVGAVGAGGATEAPDPVPVTSAAIAVPAAGVPAAGVPAAGVPAAAVPAAGPR